MEDFKIRTTTADDYNDVVSLRENLYEGLDYIPSRYHQYLDIFTGFGGYIGKEMVSFTFSSAIDDGDSILIHSLRVKKEYEGQGIATKMRDYCMKNLSITAKKKIFATTSSIVHDNLMMKKSAHLTFKRIVDESYLRDVFASHHACASLFPGNRIVVACHPYKPMSSNIERIIKSGHILLASGSPDNTSTNQSQIISAASKDKCKAGTTIFIDIFGDISDEKNISDHIFEQISRCLVSCKEDDLLLYVTFPIQQSTDTLYRIVSEYTWAMVDTKVVYGIEQPN